MNSFFLLLLLLVIGVVTAVGLSGYAFGTIAGHGVRRASRPARLRFLAALTGAGAAALYTWGALHVLGGDIAAGDGGAGSAPIRPCLEAGGPERGARTLRTSVSVIPIRLVCHTSTGERYTAAVPGYVNPAVAVLSLSGAVLAVGAGYAGELDARRDKGS
ncbi:hypothetical protein [Streptomyces cadmiisoli]|uniref:hypothetical protein n=1 Tax=Streptomyces cadmiisoli TaxID=2184053 RepID=UPI003648EA2D